MGSCYSAYSSKAVTISPSLPITRPIISSTSSNNPWPSLPSTWPSFLLEVPEPVELFFKPIKVESEIGAPPPFNTVKCLPVSALPTTATVSKGPSPASKSQSQSQQNNERSSIRKPKKVVNFKSPLTSPLRTPPERKISSPKYSPPKSPIRRIPKEKHRKRLRLLSRIKEVVQQTREHSRNHNINRSTKSTKSHVQKSDDDAEVQVNSRQTYNDYDEIATADAEVETEESLVVCFGSAADDNTSNTVNTAAQPVTVVTSYQVEYIEKVELTDLGDLTSSSSCSSDDEGIASIKEPLTSNPPRASNNLVSRVGRGIRRSFLFKNKQSKSTMASTTAATASPVGKPLSGSGGSQLRAPATFTSTTTSQLAKLFNRAPTNSSNSTDKPPALPPKSSKLRAPTGLLKPSGGIPKLLVGSKSIGNVNAAASAADSTSKLSIRKDFSTANSCDNLTIPKHPRSSISDVSSDASTLSSASSVSSFKKVTPNNQNSSSSSRLPSARSGFFDSSHRASVDSKLRSSSSSNISSADSGHHSASGTSSLASKSTHNLSHNTNSKGNNGSTTKTSHLPTSKSQNSLNSMNFRNLPTKPQSTLNSNSNGAPPPLPQKGIKPQTAHIVSTAAMVPIDRSNVGLPRPPAQYPSASRFQQHQSALYSQRLNFLYGQPVPNGTYQNSQNHQQPRPNTLPYHPEASTQSYKATAHPIASQTHPPMSNLASNSISVNNNQTSGLNRRILKSPSPHHGITNPELNKPYKRPQPTVALIPNTSTLSQHHIQQQRQPQQQHQQPGHRYSNIQHQSINPNSAQSSNSNQQPNQSTNTNYYSANYVRNAVNRLNSTNPVSHLSRTSNNNRVQQQPNQQPPALPPKTNGHHHHHQIHNPNPNQHYNQPTTHHPQFDQNGNPTTATYSPNSRMTTIETENYLAHRTASLSLKDHPMDHLNGNHHQYSPLNGQLSEWTNGINQHSNGHDSSSSSDYSSLTYNVRTRRQNSAETTPTNQATRLMSSTKNGLQDTSPRLNYTICDDDDNRQQAQQLVTTSAAAGASSLPVTSESSINNGSNSNNKRNHEMSFVAALVSRSKLAQTQQQQTHQRQTHEKQTHQQTHQQQQQTAAQDDTDVEDDDMMMMEDMMMEGDEDEDISSSSTDASSCSATAMNSNSPHHKSRANQKASKTKSSNISSTHSSIMSASICSTASTTSSFCFENGNGVGNSITSTDNSPVHSCSHHHRRPSKGRTESSASCTTISSTQESNKDFLIDDEIADQPDLQFLTCGDGKHELDCQQHQQQPNRAHFHLNLNHHPYNNNQDSSPGMCPDSLTPTNPPSSLSTQLRSANHELESLIMQHSPIKSDEYNSLPFESSQRLSSSSSQNQVDRSRSFSLNYQNGQHPTSPGTPNGGQHSPHDFATRVSSLKKRHSYTASSSGSPPHNPPMFRRPRPLSFVENEDGSSGFDSPSFRAISQDVISLKTLLFRLQGVIQNAETQNPFESSFRALHHHVPQPNHSHLSNRSSLDSLHSHHERTYSNCSETSDRTDQESVQVLREENYDLRQHIALMEQEMIEKDRTIRLLQQQMAKYSTGYVEPIPNGDTNDKSTELTNSTTQTETCETEDGINPRALSDGSSGQLVRFCCTHQMDLV